MAHPIPDINDPHIQEVGRFAVTEHVKEANDGIKFKKVSDKVLTMYTLVIDASKSDGKDAQYKAVVYERSWWKGLTLLSFRPAN
ncbi:hypothetical protein BS78_K063900 [Paspalum vaginatum]|uniref:Cystatin domain-containing protein n=1 Tax=Paspalum vaginatum TaxID=158149 RepID=A0A9W7X707_9POAL|nr:hypothetical protein BS78_K063900 [Paspalum vaginatum]